MPCTKCEEGKYKWGETGECKYDSLDACESANHKYKMQPTPLGKTYEEYAKELKEFNLSATYRVELGLADDVEKQTLQAKEILSTLKEQKKRIDSIEKLSEKASKEREKKKDNSRKAADKYFDLQDKYETAQVKYDDAEKELDSAMRRLVQLDDEIKKSTGVFDKEKSKGSKLATTLRKNLDKLEKAAKELGIKLPTAQATKVLDQLTALI
jgi:predicted  nucleic acid-binding Zn-ribbon protein